MENRRKHRNNRSNGYIIKLKMANAKIKSGFTLIEMIVAIGLVGSISILTASGLMDIIKTQKLISMNEAVAQDAQVILNLLVSEIQNNAVDYEEYYNYKKFGGFGKNYGEYAKEFKKGNTLETALGCDSSGKICYEQHLKLISADGMAKMIYAPKKYNSYMDNQAKQINEWGISALKLYRCDLKSGIPEYFSAVQECTDTAPVSDAELFSGINPFSGNFAFLSSTRTTITDLRFYITPWNDPYKAYAMPEYVYQPSVTILLSLKPSKYHFGNSAEKFSPITLQTTAAPSLLNEVKSYKP